MGALAPYRGRGSVAWIDLRGIGQGEQVFFNAGKQHLPAAAGEVSATDAITKQDIATQQCFIRFGVEADAIGRVAWDVEHLPVDTEGVEFGLIGHQLADGEGRDAHSGAAEGCVKFFQSQVSGVGGEGVDRAIVSLTQGGSVHDVIKMLVGEQQSREFDALFGQPVAHAFGGVHGDCTLLIAEKIAVGLGDSAGKIG